MKRRGLLLDRDGVVNIERGYVHTWDAFDFMPGLFFFLRRAQDLGYKTALVTNQSGVARRYYTREAFEELTRRMQAALAEQGVALDLVLACYEHPEGIEPAYTRASFWRKPKPGMLLEAVQRLNLDPARSLMVGDRGRDIKAARAAGLARAVLLGDNPCDVENVERARTLDEIDLAF